MKRDVALGIALILTGSIGLVSQANIRTSGEPARLKKASVLGLESAPKGALYQHRVESPVVTATLCQSKLGNKPASVTLLDKLSVALTDLDTMVTLQRL